MKSVDFIAHLPVSIKLPVEETMTGFKLIVFFFSFSLEKTWSCLLWFSVHKNIQSYLYIVFFTCINKATLTLVFPQMLGIVQTEKKTYFKNV